MYSTCVGLVGSVLWESWLGMVHDFVNITEKNESLDQSHKRQHNDGKVSSQRSLLGLACQWTCQMELLFRQNARQQSNLHTQVTY